MTRSKNTAFAAAVAALFAVGAGASHALAADAAGDKVKCEGVNSCKGHGSCKSAANECAGKNGCKGQSFMMMSKEDCDAAKAKMKKEG